MYDRRPGGLERHQVCRRPEEQRGRCRGLHHRLPELRRLPAGRVQRRRRRGQRPADAGRQQIPGHDRAVQLRGREGGDPNRSAEELRDGQPGQHEPVSDEGHRGLRLPPAGPSLRQPQQLLACRHDRRLPGSGDGRLHVQAARHQERRHPRRQHRVRCWYRRLLRGGVQEAGRHGRQALRVQEGTDKRLQGDPLRLQERGRHGRLRRWH